MNTQELFYQYCKTGFLPGVKHLVKSGLVDIYADEEKAFKLSSKLEFIPGDLLKTIYFPTVFDYLIEIRGVPPTFNEIVKWSSWSSSVGESLKESFNFSQPLNRPMDLDELTKQIYSQQQNFIKNKDLAKENYN